jgi:hypothetical protein
VAGWSQTLPVLHITALGMHADKSVVVPGESFHVTIHVHVREKRDRLDELVLPALTNAVDLGDVRQRTAAPDGTDFYETLTVAAEVTGDASFSPAYIDAIDPASGRALRYSSQPLTVRVVSGSALPGTGTGTPAHLLRNALLFVAGVVAMGIVLLVGLLVLVGRRRGRTGMPPPQPPPPLRETPSPREALRSAVAAYRARNDDASLDALRGELFALAGAAPGATFADALQSVGGRDPQLVRVMAVAERARFGPAGERPAAGRDLLLTLEAYLTDRGWA